jgi:hypothetical protein
MKYIKLYEDINWDDWNEEEENSELIFDLDNEIYPLIKDFNLNDRVEFIFKNKSYYATVIEKSVTISFEFDIFINGHSNNGKGKSGYCWNYCEYYKKYDIIYLVKRLINY